MRVSIASLCLTRPPGPIFFVLLLVIFISRALGVENVPSKRIRVPDFLTSELLELFEPGQAEVLLKRPGTQTMSYRLFTPVNRDAKIQYPLVVWLHGYDQTEIRNRNTGQLLHLEDLIFREPKHPEKYPFYFLAPQMPEGVRSWDSESLMALIDKIVASHAIDPQCISVTGLSVGGSGCWQLALHYPDRIAAASPMASGGCDVNQIAKLTSVPVWAFNSTGDRVIPIERIRQTIDALKDAGGSCRLTEIDSNAHGCWNEAFRGHEVLAWLISQKKGTMGEFPPENSAGLTNALRSISSSAATVVSNNWPQLTLLGGLTAICMVVWRQWRAKSSL